jgi:Xaa-Pro aminopeptidase
VLILGGEDSHLAVSRAGWIDDRVSATSTGSTRAPFGAAAAARLEKMALAGRRVGLVGIGGHEYVNVRQPEGYVNHTTARRVIDAMPGAEIVDATDVLAAARYVKSEEEIDLLRRSIVVAEAAAVALHEHARAGTPAAEVFGQMMLAEARLTPGSVEVAWASGRWGERRRRFTSPPPGVLEPGTLIATELMPDIGGYQAQVAEPHIVGDVTDEQREVWDLGIAAFERACEVMRPGRTWGEVEADVAEVADGTRWKIDFLLHGRGLGNDGPLLIPTDTHERVRDDPLAADTVFVLKPNAFPAAQETAIARSHDVTWGDAIVVRADRVERLGTRPIQLVATG